MNLIDSLKSDWTYINGFRRIIGAIGKFDPDAEYTLADAMEEACDDHDERVFISFEGQETTYAQFDRRACQFAQWGQSVGLKAGDCVALFMENRPDYIAFWAGMAKLAVKTALINYNLTGPGLAHCVDIVNARAIVMNPELAPSFETARAQMKLNLGAFVLGGDVAGLSRIDAAVDQMPMVRPDKSVRAGVKGSEIALYIYTSGTTGLPKAAKITNVRARGLMRVFVDATDAHHNDRILLTLPLYHATGGMCGVGTALNAGACLILRRKFSASHFWQEAIDGEATMLVYIGEFGRYLMNQPPSTLEHSHKITKGFGNGLRADVWAEFVERTGIKRLVEFYGSTEGNVNFFNLDGKIGAVGRIPRLLRSRLPARLLKFDVETEQPVRGPDGLCVEAGVDEPGEAVGPITGEPRQRFDGYNDEAQSKKKLLRDVFEKGDLWFRTGDLMKMDADGYVYFVDRVGDTFRWKSENVSTSEVEIAISSMAGVKHAVVYGVTVPGYDGRAGMAAITPRDGVDVQALYAHLSALLPGYARPVFLRLQGEVETTGTLKYRKVDLVNEGFDPMKIKDPLFVIDNDRKTYVPIDFEMFRKVDNGAVRL
ncbi:MAG TPA: long-chain-acyl-CoA synthetase [Hyphomonadaceae bacterium]|nr:long-chain-acyl-CoA synthetase [Hyphomonadaceae bacterium]